MLLEQIIPETKQNKSNKCGLQVPSYRARKGDPVGPNVMALLVMQSRCAFDGMATS